MNASLMSWLALGTPARTWVELPGFVSAAWFTGGTAACPIVAQLCVAVSSAGEAHQRAHVLDEARELAHEGDTCERGAHVSVIEQLKLRVPQRHLAPQQSH